MAFRTKGPVEAVPIVRQMIKSQPSRSGRLSGAVPDARPVSSPDCFRRDLGRQVAIAQQLWCILQGRFSLNVIESAHNVPDSIGRAL